MQRPLFFTSTPDRVGLTHEDCVQFLLLPDRFLWSNIPGISYLHVHTSSEYVPYRYDLWDSQSICRLVYGVPVASIELHFFHFSDERNQYGGQQAGRLNIGGKK